MSKPLKKTISPRKRKLAASLPANVPSDEYLATSMAEVEDEHIKWLWYPYFATGELTILEGDPDLGKSYVSQVVGMHIADGKRLPSIEKDPIEPIADGVVAYFDLENHRASVTGPRLTSNNIQRRENFFQEEAHFTIDNEEAMESVKEAIRKRRPKLVVFDTLNTYIGTKYDPYRSNEASAALHQFRRIAKECDCSVVVVRHLNKGKGPARYRGQGSIAFSGMARVVMQVNKVPEEHIPDGYDSKDELRGISIVKGNNLPDWVKRKVLTYHISELPHRQSRFHFRGFIDGLTADDMMPEDGFRSERDDKKEDQAKSLVNRMLGGGQQVAAEEMEEQAARNDMTIETLRNTAKKMGVIFERASDGDRRKMLWRMREDPHLTWLRNQLKDGPVLAQRLHTAREAMAIDTKIYRRLYESLRLERKRSSQGDWYIAMPGGFPEGVFYNPPSPQKGEKS